MDLGACGGSAKTPGGIPASSKAKLTIILRKCPFPVRAIQVDGGSEFYGEFEGPRRNTVSSSSSFPQGLPYPWNGGTAQPDLPGGVLWYSEDEVDLGTQGSTVKVDGGVQRKRRDSSLGRGALGGAEQHWTFRVSHMIWTYTRA